MTSRVASGSVAAIVGLNPNSGSCQSRSDGARAGMAVDFSVKKFVKWASELAEPLWLPAGRVLVCWVPGFTKSKRLQAHSPATVKT